jgi:hypothetical protein
MDICGYLPAPVPRRSRRADPLNGSAGIRLGLTRAEQVGLGLLVVLVAVIGYRRFARRHPLGAGRRKRLTAGR